MKFEPANLAIYLHQILAGTLMRLPEKGDLNVFEFGEDYLADPHRPTLSLGFKSKTGGIGYKPRAFNTGVHPFFANLLPEGKLRAYIAERDGVSAARDFPLLLALGDDLPGAVVIRPAEAGRLSDEGFEIDVDGPPLADDQPLEFSLAGAQLKFSAVAKATGGLTIPAYGRGGSWIVKLPSERFEAVPENEFAMLQVAARAGLDVPATDLVPLASIEGLPAGMRKDGHAFAIRRFDRDGEDGRKRIHIEDFAQVFRLPPREKYKKASYGNVAEVIWAELGPDGLRDFVARLVFNLAIGNGDMHLKNWSLIYRDPVKPELAPVYDYLSTLTYVSQTESMGLSLAGTTAFQDVSDRLLARFAGKHHLPVDLVLSAAREAAERTLDAWSDLRAGLQLPSYIIRSIDEHIRSVPFLRRPAGRSRG